MKSIFFTFVIFVLVVLFYAAMGHHLYWQTDPLHFGTYIDSFVTFIQVSTFDNWTNIYYGVANGCLNWPGDYGSLTFTSDRIETAFGSFPLPVCTASAGQPVASAIIFITFAFVEGYILVSLNLAYVYALIMGVTPGLLLFLQILLSAVKLAWNRYFVHRPHFGAAHLPLRIELLCQCFMTLFTFLASPIIATFFLDNTCFRYVILGQPTVDSTFIITPFDCPVSCFMDPAGGFPCYSGCGVSRNVTDVATTSVVPSWLYSYQCASSVLTNYIPVLVFAYVWSGILYPVVRTALTLRGNKITTWMQQLRSGSRVFSAAEGKGLAGAESDELGSVRAPKPLLRSSIVLCRLCLNVAVMLTYGLACPLLSLAVCADSWTQIGVLQVLQYKLAVVIGLVSNSDAIQSGSSNPSENSTVEPSSVISNMHARSEGSDVAASDRPTERSVEPSMVKFSTISKAAEPSEISTLLHVSLVLEAESRAMFAGVSGSMWMAIVVSSLFWAFFLFDMMGDVYGNAIGGVVFALCFVYTIGIYALAHHWPVQCGVGKLCRRDGRTRETLVEAMRGSEVNNEGF
jgi:hypothetical protein